MKFLIMKMKKKSMILRRMLNVWLNPLKKKMINKELMKSLFKKLEKRKNEKLKLYKKNKIV